MQVPFSLHRRNYYPWLFIGLLLVVNILAFYWPLACCKCFSLPALPPNRLPELFLSITGAIAAFTHFLYSQHNHNTERFIGLFREFNTRYDHLNDGLNTLLLNDGTHLLSFKDRQLLYDYFNLCAEEYLYFKAGYIDTKVWQAWLRGMGYFASNSEIRNLWESELKSGSYYGFTLDLIDEVIRGKR